MANDEDDTSDRSDQSRTFNTELRKHEKEAINPFTKPLADADSTEDVLQLARDFLKDDSIRNEPREKKVEFLESKGLDKAAIDKLLAEAPNRISPVQDLKTVHDSTRAGTGRATKSDGPKHQTQPDVAQSKPQLPVRDTPPIITYPEFLLKPQKPAPLVTFQRLAYAAYTVAGLSTLAHGASRYLVGPLLESLNEARHELSSSAIADLEKLNTKLESTVSHIPYTASAAALKAQHGYCLDEHGDADSEASDPTELFHRDIATQTTPNLSRSSSSSALDKQILDVTTKQATRLSSLVASLESLNLTINPDPATAAYLPTPPTKKLQASISELQNVLDRLESTYNPFRTDYSSFSSSASDAKATKNKDNNEAAKFRAEIRALKGAFLSSRNFPSARPVTATGR